MKTDMCVTMELDVADAREVQRFEENLRGWLRHQPQVVAVSTTTSGGVNDIAWREARKQTFPTLKNPFSPGRSR